MPSPFDGHMRRRGGQRWARAPERIDPVLHEAHRGDAREAPDGLVDLAGGRAPFLVAEEEPGQEPQLLATLLTAPDRRPEAIHDGAADPRGARPEEPLLGLPVVEEEVPGLVQ